MNSENFRKKNFYQLQQLIVESQKDYMFRPKYKKKNKLSFFSFHFIVYSYSYGDTFVMVHLGFRYINRRHQQKTKTNHTTSAYIYKYIGLIEVGISKK